MCRYAWHNYRDHFACFLCRKAFKYWQWEECDEITWNKRRNLLHVPREIVCPDCARPMVDMGLDFKAPPRSDSVAWQILETLHSHGFNFQGCGCYVGFKPPKTLRELPRWLESHRCLSEGETLLRKIDKRAARKH